MTHEERTAELIMTESAIDLFLNKIRYRDFKVTIESVDGNFKDTFTLVKGGRYDYLRGHIEQFYKDRYKQTECDLADHYLNNRLSDCDEEEDK